MRHACVVPLLALAISTMAATRCTTYEQPTLRRLEQRGLVERKNEVTNTPRRTTNVRLTDRGREVAKRLTK